MDVSGDSRARLIVVSLCVVLLVSGVGFGFDRLLRREGATRTDILLTSNSLTGVVAGFLFYSLSNQHRERRRLVQQRLQIIAEMNHHIRNALQVIKYATVAQTHADSVELIHSSVERIEWILREVLPEYAPAPTAAAGLEEHPQATHAGLRNPVSSDVGGLYPESRPRALTTWKESAYSFSLLGALVIHVINFSPSLVTSFRIIRLRAFFQEPLELDWLSLGGTMVRAEKQLVCLLQLASALGIHQADHPA
jgi:hypothetical protein